MKKIVVFFLFCMSVLPQFRVSAQNTTTPIANFTVDPDKANTIVYQYTFTDSLDKADVIIKKIKAYFTDTNFIVKAKFDSISTFTGYVRNIHIAHYTDEGGWHFGGPKSRILSGEFSLSVKDGKYKVVIHNMSWFYTAIVATRDDYMTGTNYTTYHAVPTSELLDLTCTNKDGTKWKTLAKEVLPELNEELIKVFTLQPPHNKPKIDHNW